MADLILKFFQEEMTQAEEQALSERLLSSTEEALRFGEEAQKAYLGFGLPDPKWPGGGAPPSPWSATLGLKSILLYPALLAAGLAGWTIWHFHARAPLASALTPQLGQVSVINNPIVSKVIPEALQREKPVEKTFPAQAAPGRTTSPSVQVTGPSEGRALPVAPPQPSAAFLTPVLTPVDMSAKVHKTFSDLSVVIRRPSVGEVTVRILKRDGTPMVLLYQGQLKAGKWGFDWDGRLADGHLAPPDYYQIQVQSGPLVQTKSILIH